jgi:hypothetical protein
VRAYASILTALALAVPALGLWAGPVLAAPGSISAVATSLTFPTVIRHVIVVPEENAACSDTLSDPGFYYYWSHYAHARCGTTSGSNTYGYYGVCHPSAPNYAALTAGTPNGLCGSDSAPSWKIANVFTALQAQGRTWAVYAESIPSNCYTSDTGTYVAHHNPALFYRSIDKCASWDVPFSGYSYALTHGTLPPFSVVVPNMCDDAHQCSLSTASGWLKTYVLGPLASGAYASTTEVLVTFDEAYISGSQAPGGYCAGSYCSNGGPVYFVAVGPVSPESHSLGGPCNQFDALASALYLLDVPGPIGHAGTSGYPPMKALF